MSRWGLTLPLPMTSIADQVDLVKRAEAAGYTDLWSGETAGPDGFTPLAFAAAHATKVRVGTGVVGVFQRGPALLAQQAASMTDATGGRFVLGIGASSDRIVEGWNGIPFEKPYSKVKETLDFLDVALKGDRTDNGFKLETKPQHEIPVVLAALRGRMLKLAVERASGAFSNFLPISGLPQVVKGIEGAPDGFELLCRFFCLPGKREEVEPIARFMFSSYITVPVYEAFYRWLGHGDAIDPMVEAWKAKDRQKAAAEAPWELIDEMFILGDPDEMHERLARFTEGGITLPVLTPITSPDKLGDLIEELAPR